MSADQIAKRIIQLAREKKARQIVRMDIHELSGFADYFVIMSGDSSIQIKALADHIEDELRREAIYPFSKEGYEHLRWVLLDYIDVVVHIFNNESREFYGIERLWADAKMDFISEEEA